MTGTSSGRDRDYFRFWIALSIGWGGLIGAIMFSGGNERELLQVASWGILLGPPVALWAVIRGFVWMATNRGR